MGQTCRQKKGKEENAKRRLLKEKYVKDETVDPRYKNDRPGRTGPPGKLCGEKKKKKEGRRNQRPMGPQEKKNRTGQRK